MKKEDICFMSACDIAEKIKTQELSSQEITEIIIERIEKINPKINAYCTPTFDIARDLAKNADESIKRGEKLGLLHGIPTSIKDLMETEGVRTTFGTKIHENYIPKEDDYIVKTLKNAGIVMLGKTNTPTYGYWPLTKNKIFGETYNPWDQNRNSGGSSGGAAAAVASGLGPLALGSDGGSSIRIPSSFCGVYGIKPTFGLIPRYPWNLHGIAFFTLDHYGPIVRYVNDAALMLDVMVNYYESDRLSVPKQDVQYIKAIKEKPSKLKIGFSLDLGFIKAIEPEIEKSIIESVQKFEKLEWSVEEAKIKIRKAYRTFALIVTSGYALDINLKKYRDIIEEDLVKMIEAGQTYTAVDLKRAELQREKIYEVFQQFFKNYDILITPTAAVLPLEVGKWRFDKINDIPVSPEAWFSHCYSFNLTGHPAASIPCGWTEEGLPIGMQIIGRRFEDSTVLQVSKAFEEIAPWQDKRPQFEI